MADGWHAWGACGIAGNTSWARSAEDTGASWAPCVVVDSTADTEGPAAGAAGWPRRSHRVASEAAWARGVAHMDDGFVA